MRTLLVDRRVWPQIVDDTTAALASAGPQPPLLGDSVAAIMDIEPGKRQSIQLDKLKGTYRFDNGNRRIAVSMDVTFSNSGRQRFLEDTVAKWLKDNAVRPDAPYRIVPETVSINLDKFREVVVNEAGRPSGSDQGGGGGGGGSSQSSDEQNPTAASGDGSGGGSGPMGSGGIQGKRGITGGGTQAPGSGLGFGGSDGTQFGGGTGGDGTGAGSGFGGSSDDQVKRGGGGKPQAEDASKFRLDEMAAIGDPPALFKAGEKVFQAVVSFEVELPAVAGGGDAGGAQ
jgi:hypothetical protein